MSYDLMLNKAIELQNNGALQQAEEIYLQLLQTMPENSDVWNLLGLIEQSKNNYLHAKDCFLNAVKYAPTPFFAHFFNLGLTYKALHCPKEAIDALLQAVKLKPDLKEGYNLLGVLYAGEENLEDAIKSFCKALEIDKDFEEARANLCFYTNDIDRLIKLADENKDNFTYSFLAAQSSENLAIKETYLRRAIEVCPERSDALLMLADVLRQRENFNEALLFYHKVLNLDDKDIGAILGCADIYLILKEYDKAEQYYLKSFDISRDICGAHINYGALLYQQRRTAEALEEYKAAVALDPNRADVCYNLALILKEVGDLEEALGLMFHAHLKEPQNDLYAINIMETLSALYEENAEAALKIAINWQKQEPDNLFSKRALASFGGNDVENNDTQYAEKLFDEFAETYENTLSCLNPQIIQTFKHEISSLSGQVLDLGCGTGLAATALKNKDNHFDGVDISQKMLDQAKAKELYEHLYHEDIVDFLTEHNVQKYDYVLAFDVFCYMESLEKVLGLLKGKRIAFSIETADEARQENYYMASNGRYKHKIGYVEQLLKKYHFKDVDFKEIVLRKEKGEDVKGVLFYSAEIK